MPNLVSSPIKGEDGEEVGFVENRFPENRIAQIGENRFLFESSTDSVQSGMQTSVLGGQVIRLKFYLNLCLGLSDFEIS